MSERRWDLIGFAIGAAIGVGDVALFSAFGARMEVGGYNVASLVLALFVISYSGLGFAFGRLAMARTRARADSETIRRQLEQLELTQRELVENEKLAAIGRLAAGIAHEVRNPLGVIRASASLVQESFKTGEDSHRACQFICEETDRLDGLIASLLAFARPTTPDVQPIVVDDVLSRALRLVADELEGRKINVDYSASSPLPTIQGDPDLLSQAVHDLALNAAEALHHEGRILVRASAENSSLYVDVCDNGPGVPNEIAEQIFEPFFTTKAQGTGLGLAMVSRIVEAHGGHVELIQDAGLGDTGACFRIKLPAVEEARV